jgi:iron complex outermembrane receptor protein
MQMVATHFINHPLMYIGPLNDIAYRFTGSYENSESFRDNVTKSYYIILLFLFKVSDKTEIILQGDYLKDYWTPDFGTGIIGKNIRPS